MSNRQKIYELNEWRTAQQRFSKPIIPIDSVAKQDFEELEKLTKLCTEINKWNDLTADYLNSIPSKMLSRRFNRIAKATSKGIKLRHKLDTWQIQKIVNKYSKEKTVAIFLDARRELKLRLEVLADIAIEAMIKVDMALPSQVGDLKALWANSTKFAELLGGKKFGPIHTGLIGTSIGATRIFFRERKHVRFVIGHHFRNSGRKRPSPLIKRINKAAGEKLLDKSRSELIISLYKLYEETDLPIKNANQITLDICKRAQKKGTKPWKALVAARDLIRHAGVDPNNKNFITKVSLYLEDDLTYTHTPGKEWIVREYGLAKQLLTADSKVQRSSDSIVLSQAGASIAPGALASYRPLLKLAAHYLSPVKVYSDSIVSTTGEDHRRHRKAFNQYFKKGKILSRSEFIEQTATQLVSQAKEKAKKNGDIFDFKNDLANNFPIRIICNFLGIPQQDAEQVQTWTVDLVRSLDAGAGLDLKTLKRGNLAAKAYYKYLIEKINAARNGQEIPGIIGKTCNTDLQNDHELLANLVTLTFAGFETTTGLLTMGFYELLQRPEQMKTLSTSLVDLKFSDDIARKFKLKPHDLRWMAWAHLEREGRISEEDQNRYDSILEKMGRDNQLRELIDKYREQEIALGNCVEEMLRWTTPGSVIPLTAERQFDFENPNEMQIQGCPVNPGREFTVKKGDTVLVELGPANVRGCPVDAGKFETRPNEFDITRTNNNKHLSFGVSHVCIGADLAVENSKRMIEQVLRQMPGLTLHDEPKESDGQLFFTYDELKVKI